MLLVLLTCFNMSLLNEQVCESSKVKYVDSIGWILQLCD